MGIKEDAVSWNLPKSLLLYHCSSFEAARSREGRESEVDLIKMPEYKPAVFEIFVEWMYYGGNSQPFGLKAQNDNSIKCWTLGNKLGCPAFANYIIRISYGNLTRSLFPELLDTHIMQMVLDNTAVESKLRQLYASVLVDNFADTSRILGTAEEWNDALSGHDDVRVQLLQSMRSAKKRLKPIDAYLEPEDGLSKDFINMKIGT